MMYGEFKTRVNFLQNCYEITTRTIAIDRQPAPERLKFLSQVCALGPTREARYCRQCRNVNCITFLTFTAYEAIPNSYNKNLFA